MATAHEGKVVPRASPDLDNGHLPPLPPKDVVAFQSPNLESYFKPLPPSRPASIYSVNRATLSGQLSQLTSINLPDADSLATSVAAIPTATAAAKALSNAAGQIKSWIKKAAEVLGGLDAEDDVEWAGSSNREGLSDVEAAIKRFEKLVVTYISSVEEARKRPDIQDVTKADMTMLLDTLDDVVNAWDKVNKSLKEVKKQVEMAMEWEELWNTVLGEIGSEIEELGTLVFEMEEKRYNGGLESLDQHGAVDIKELETIVEEAPTTTDAKTSKVSRFGNPPTISPQSPLASPTLPNPQDDAGLLTLFARMQPLRASLDFLPMRLSTYETRAGSIFPSACAELENRRKTLEKKYKNLENDAESLRQELGEDRWVVVFRTAARQAQKMCESVEKGILKLQEALDSDALASTPNLLAKRIGDYEAKKNNYGPAIRKVLSMIEKGVKERLTVNGEVLRIHADTRKTWSGLEKKLRDADAALEEVQAGKSQQLRDSISTILSTDASGMASTAETPGSSPASSVALGPTEGKSSLPSTPDVNLSRSRGSSIRSVSSSRPPASRRVASQPTVAQNRPPFSLSRLSSVSPSPSSRAASSTPTPSVRSRVVSTPAIVDNRPRWNPVAKPDDKDTGHQRYKPTAYAIALKNSKPSVYSYRSPRSTVSSALPSPSLPFAGSPSPGAPATARRAASSMGFHGLQDSSPSPVLPQPSSESRPRSRLYRPSHLKSAARVPSVSGSQRSVSMLPLPSNPNSPLVQSFHVNGETNGEANGDVDGDANLLDTESPCVRRLPARPASSMAIASASSVANGRRSSLLPMPRFRAEKEERRWKP